MDSVLKENLHFTETVSYYLVYFSYFIFHFVRLNFYSTLKHLLANFYSPFSFSEPRTLVHQRKNTTPASQRAKQANKQVNVAHARMSSHFACPTVIAASNCKRRDSSILWFSLFVVYYNTHIVANISTSLHLDLSPNIIIFMSSLFCCCCPFYHRS